jgi:hypothetical protein
VRRLVLVIAVLGIVVAGCTAVSGQPTPAASARPRDIRLDAVDPCSLFTPDVQKQLGITRPLKADKGASYVFTGDVPACDARGDASTAFSVSVTLAIHDGIELYQPGRVVGSLTPKRFQGYPALLLKPSKMTDNCAVLVDIAPGQILAVMYADGGNTPPTPQDELCLHAEQATNLTMVELLRRG